MRFLKKVDVVTGALSGLYRHLVIGLKDLDLNLEAEGGARNASVGVE